MPSMLIGAVFISDTPARAEDSPFMVIESGTETLLIFNPNDRLLYAMGRLMQRKFKGDLDALERAQ